ncbi:MAG: hypothetical protein NZ518_09440, partial [Dehalococcoidia bacterium]|nr:hypothetical protein [Dehalococcoidia bacterium]
GGIIAAVVAAILYAGLTFLTVPFTEQRIIASVSGAIVYLLFGIVATLMTTTVSAMETRIAKDAALINELTVTDAATGTIKPQYARQFLADEILRARRYRHTFSILIIGLAESQLQPSSIDYDAVFAQAGRVLVERLRATDKVSILRAPTRILCILIETPVSGAQIIADRIIEETQMSTGVQFRTGIASFPNDAVDADGLIEEAESALKFANLMDERIVTSEILRTP